jgi:hypothetical protein
MLLSRGPRVEQQVTSGNASVDSSGPDVDSNVSGAKEEELRGVVGIREHKFPAVAPLAIPGLPEHGRGGLGERTLVWDCDSKHGLS